MSTPYGLIKANIRMFDNKIKQLILLSSKKPIVIELFHNFIRVFMQIHSWQTCGRKPTSASTQQLKEGTSKQTTPITNNLQSWPTWSNPLLGVGLKKIQPIGSSI